MTRRPGYPLNIRSHAQAAALQPQAMPARRHLVRIGVLTGAAALLLGAASTVRANGNPVILQWFELSWDNMERRMPDFFNAGYGATWLPAPSKASFGSAGYDVFARFDLGSPNTPSDNQRETAFGTERSFGAMIDEMHRANGLAYIDSIMNHNGARTSNAQFHADGGWPGFWADNPPTTWGDFHDGTTQSHDPSGGAGPYNLFEGDLVGLVDIAQESNNQFIRHPVDPDDPNNIPPGNVRNRPDPNNARFYPDQSLAPKNFFNPAGARNFSIHPFNTSDPMAGDPYPENTTGLLMRWTQYMVDVHKVDGFRLDAAKHIPSWFWNEYWDAAVFDRRVSPNGTTSTPFSFVESVESNFFTYNNYVRKDGFGNRDALDLNGAGQARDIITAKGFGNWSNLLNAHIDNQDNGFNDGSVGVNHVFSHDNGSIGDGGSPPALPADDRVGLHMWAYMLMRTGPAVVYHNAREMHTKFAGTSRFWVREGNPTALGLAKDQLSTDTRLTTLVKLHNRYGRGEFDVLRVDSDQIVFQRRTNLGGGNYAANVLVGCNDRYDSGFDNETVFTSFPQGTRLHELTGNATDPVVDPANSIPDIITVGANGQVTLTIPRNAQGGSEHHRGYVVYGPATPSGTLTIQNKQSTIPPDSNSVQPFARRLSEIDVVTASTFTIDLVTTKTDPSDPNWDDTAIFRINQGFFDANGNGGTDVTTGEFAGYEGFVTLNQPLYNTANPTGHYQQTINSDLLPEGYNYLSVIAFRHRNAGDPLYQEWRRVLYVDRQPPEMEIDPFDYNCLTDSATITIRNLDRTATRVHVFVDLDENDPIPPLDFGNKAFDLDRGEWFWNISGLIPGAHSLTIVALEEPQFGVIQSQGVTRIDFNVPCSPDCPGDAFEDGMIDILDLNVVIGNFGESVTPGENGDVNFDGVVNITDLNTVIGNFGSVCN